MSRFFLALVTWITFASAAIAQTQVFSSTYVANSIGNTGYSYRQTVPLISASGSQLRLKVDASTATAFAASHVSVCVQSTSYNCVSTPVEVTFNGGFSGFGVGAFAAPLASDWINFTAATGQTLVMVMDVTTDGMARNSSGPAGWDSLTTSWNAQSPSGSWNSFSTNYGFVSVEVQTPATGPTMLLGSGIQGGGRLTLDPNNSRMSVDIVSSTVYYVEENGITVPVIDGAGNVQNVSFAGQSLTIDSTWIASGLYDVYEAWNGGSPVLCSGPQRTSPNFFPAAADVFVKGVKVNGSDISVCRASPSASIDCPQYQCKLLGSIKVSAIAGVLRCDFNYKQQPECGVWNNDNQIDMILSAGNFEPLSGGPYGNGAYNMASSWGPLHGDPKNSLSVVAGRPEMVSMTLDRRARTNSQSPSGSSFQIGIGLNSTNTPTGLENGNNMELYTSTVSQILGTGPSTRLSQKAFVGVESVTALEQCPFGTCVAWVTSTDVLLEARYKN